MPLEYQHGSVYLQGKRRKAWYGKYRVLRRDSATGAWVTKQKNKKIGLKSEFNKFEAEQKLRDMIASDNCSAAVDTSDVSPRVATLNWFFEERYLPMMSCRETTKKKTKWEIRRYILQKFGDRPLRAVGPFEIQTHLNQLATNFSNSVVRHAYVNLRSIFKSAVDLDFLAKSPARNLKMPETRVPDKRTLDPTIIMKLLNALEHPMDRCAIVIGVFCALRTAEVFGLTWGSYQGEYLAVRDTAFEGHLQKHKLKTKESRALVPIPDLVQPIIATWHSACPNTGPDALMFPTKGKGSRTGQLVPFDSTNFMERRIHPVADQLGISRRLVTFQVMRRTVGTDLQFHGTLKDAQAALRHKSAGTTADVYMQPVTESVKAALNARTEAVFRSVSSKSGGRKDPGTEVPAPRSE